MAGIKLYLGLDLAHPLVYSITPQHLQAVMYLMIFLHKQCYSKCMLNGYYGLIPQKLDDMSYYGSGL